MYYITLNTLHRMNELDEIQLEKKDTGFGLNAHLLSLHLLYGE